MAHEGTTRRERLRAQTLTEIQKHALAQIAEGGPEALSLNAIARSMQMSGPAIYRYFASREDLLVALVADSYEDLADAVAAAAGDAGRPTGEIGVPDARLRAVAAAYRGWALAHPHRYRLVFASRYGSGLVAPERFMPAATRTMNALSAAVADLADASRHIGLPTPLVRQLESWREARPTSADLPPAALHLSVVAWTRLHGIVSLEIEGVFVAMDLDPALLLDAEIDQIVASANA